MKAAIVTLFPELFEAFLQASFVGRARQSGVLSVHLEPLRRHGLGKHLSVDDTPYGGGSGMVMRVDCVMSAIEAAEGVLGERSRRVLLTPQGQPANQTLLASLCEAQTLSFICGRYEGFDDRIRSFVDQEVSLGDFVMTGGEVAAMALLEGCVRLLPGVLGNADSSREESFGGALGGGLEYPHYTRPATYRGQTVPDVLVSGDHERIRKWRTEQAARRTRARRPDLLPPGAREDQ